MSILLYPDPILRQKSMEIKNVHSFSTKMIIKKLIKNLAATETGVGLSAPQVGYNVNIFIMNISKSRGQDSIFINPEIIEKSEENIIYKEGCLSFPGLYLDLESPKWIKIRYLDGSGRAMTDILEGLPAVCANHEIHHLLGELMIDREKK